MLDKILIVVCGVSGAGKDSIVNEYLKNNTFLKFLTYTTRPPREGEADGITGRYITVDEFKNLINKGKLIEYNYYNNNYYGTPKSELLKLKKSDIITIPSLSAAEKFKKIYNNTYIIFVLPPSYKEWKNRIEGRGNERIKIGITELDKADKIIDYVIVNDDIEKAVKEFGDIINVIKNNVSNSKYKKVVKKIKEDYYGDRS